VAGSEFVVFLSTSLLGVLVKRKHLLLVFGLTVAVAVCTSQESQLDRQPAVAGMFYPAEADELARMLELLYARALPAGSRTRPLALISPHAGYVYSGEVAASTFSLLEPDNRYEHVFILGPSHRVPFDGAAIYCRGDFLTPLGRVRVAKELGRELVDSHSVFSDRGDAHLYEHSIEVQLPFLQHRLKRDFTIVPIAIGTGDPGTCEEIAEALRPYLKAENLFIVSTDFSHYPSYDDAKRVDGRIARAITMNEPAALLREIQRSESEGIPHLSTCMCGWMGVLTLLNMTQSYSDARYEIIQYRNSGDAEVGDRSRVVGYYGIALFQGREEGGALEFGDAEKRMALTISRDALEGHLLSGGMPEINVSTLTGPLKGSGGAFVSLYKQKELRGCIGRFVSPGSLYEVIRELTISAASEDPRFAPVSPAELAEIEIEISVLTPLRRIQSIDEIELGRHGVYIIDGSRGGTFLPQVAQKTGWTKEEFLGHCARDKVGIGWYGWKNADIYVYEATVFGENDLGGLGVPKRRDP
jgi:AmmeMemoRadiSam system protein B/AmmeMemoRadiSam system protein A